MKKRFTTPGIAMIAVSIALVQFLIPGAQTAAFSKQVLSSHPSAAAASSSVRVRELSLEERVRYQWAIEQVYWEHKLWPSQNQEPKPRLEDVLPLPALRRKIEDTLRKSSALEQRYNHIITAVQLQAEIDRMANQTRQPDLLAELWRVLGNDPYLIAECLARPMLVDRLIQNWYGSDEQVHQELKARAESALNKYPFTAQMRQLGGEYSESELVRTEATPTPAGPASEASITRLSATEWDQAISKLESAFADQGAEYRAECLTCSNKEVMNLAPRAAVPLDRVSALQEENQRFYVTAVLSRSSDRVKVARVEWPKTNFDQWWDASRNQFETNTQTAAHTYQLPAISQTGCVDDTWKQTKLLPEGIFGSKAVWTGTEMIVWGGGVDTGARYNPATDTWTTMSLTNAPFRRNSHTAVWTGTEMIVWGGCNTTGHLCGENSGGRYNPVTDTWRPTTTANAPGARRWHTAVWTGSVMIVWGGCVPGFDGRCPTINSGGIYNPATDSWTPTTLVGAPSPRALHTAVWSGSVMIIWGAAGDSTGGRYDPATNTWMPTSTINVPSARSGHTAIWGGTEMIVWGGLSGTAFSDGGRYDPSADLWTPTSTAGAPTARYNHSAVWTGSEMIVWGGSETGPGLFNSGGRYNPATNTWIDTSTINAPSPRAGHVAVWTGSLMLVWGGAADKSGGRFSPSANTWTATNNNDTGEARDAHDAVWTGTEMIVWGGRGAFSGDLNTGMLYSPATDNWRPTTIVNAPTARFSCGAVWTGLEMIVWGGGYIAICGGPGTGGRYNPTTNVWTATSTVGAPENRGYHSTVWSGTELIVWGGDCDTTFNTGGRYNPSTDMWRATSTTNAPASRYLHSAVWSGSEMIVWGGVEFGTGVYFNTGGRYNPVSDTWQPTTAAGAPTGRTGHRAVWTGNEMVVWGGWVYFPTPVYFNTGGRYNPATNTWLPTSTFNAPEARTGHSAIWTGSRMVVWGGVASQSSLGPIYSTGGRYDPASDDWAPTNTLGAPSARDGHTAVWTGSQMIVWGGSYKATGGRYCVTLDPVFNISAAPPALTVTQGGSASSVITVSSLSGFSSNVTLSCQAAPAGVTWSFAPNPATPPANGSTTSTLTVTVGANVASGMYFFPIVAVSGSVSRTLMFQLSVLASPDFYVDCYPEIVSAAQGGSTSTQPRLWSQNGFSSPVTMSCSGAPAGVTCSFFFNPQTPPADGSATNDLTISVGPSVPSGIYAFQIVGAYGALVRTFAMQLTVLPAGCSYDLSPIYSDTFTASGGSSSVTITTSAGCAWQAVSNADWISITSGASGVGSGTVNYTVAPNSSNGARLVRMTIAGQTYQIYQTGATCPNVIAPTSHTFTAAGWTGVVSVSAPGPCSWTAVSNATWITVLSVSATNGSGAVTYQAAANASASSRTGTITIAGLTFTVYQAGSFADVPPNHQFYSEISKLSARGITLGCGGVNFCPNDPVTREQMAAFIMRAKGEFNPPVPLSQRFGDVPPENIFCNFIDRMAVLGITLGCTPDHSMYCPSDPVRRDQMAAFLLRGLGEFDPPTPTTQRFSDVPPSNVFYNFIDRLAVLQITVGCTPDHSMYCPNDSVTRAQMAAFLVRAFGL